MKTDLLFLKGAFMTTLYGLNIRWSALALTFVVSAAGSLSTSAQNAPNCPPVPRGPSDKVPLVILQQGATEAAKAFEDERSITKSKYLEALRKFVILRVAKEEANRKAQEALVLEAAEIKRFENQITTQLTNLVGKEEAANLIASWERGATAEEQEKILKDFAISGKTYRGLFADLAKAKGLSEKQIAKARYESFAFAEFSAGEFFMGSPKDEAGRDVEHEARRRVVITKPFEMAKTEVTQLQWYLVMGNNPSYFGRSPRGEDKYDLGLQKDDFGLPGVWLRMNHPVEKVSWNDVQEYIRRLNELDPKYTYRLPTEAEWEYAARAGTTSAYFFGDSAVALSEHANYSENSGSRTQPVASKKPNPKGLYDVHGNVWEWCGDWYCDSPSGGVDPTGPSIGGDRVIRGGSWGNSARHLRSDFRGLGDPEIGYDSVGFRLVRTPK